MEAFIIMINRSGNVKFVMPIYINFRYSWPKFKKFEFGQNYMNLGYVWIHMLVTTWAKN